MIKNLKSKIGLAGFFIVYKGSTIVENKDTYGWSHVCEHLLSKSFDRFEEKFNIDAINSNAYTSSNEVVFFITGLDNKVYKWKDKLIESLSNVDNVTEEEFESEKKVVLEEYYSSFNEQNSAHLDNLFRKVFNHYGPIGLAEDIENFTFQNFKDYYNKYFSKPTLIIYVSKKHKYHNDKLTFQDYTIKDKSLNYLENNKYIFENGNDFNNKSSIGILSPIVTEDFAYVKFINYMLNYGLSSPLTKEIRVDNGLTYGIYTTLNRFNENAVNITYTLTNNENVDKLIDIYKDVLKNKDKYITKERFSIIKEYHKNQEKIKELSKYENISNYILPTNSVWSISDILKKVKFDKINEVYDKYFNVDNYYISIDKKEFI
jgi:zinc protease